MSNKVIRVSATEFELDDGRVFPHVEQLNPVPSPEEFQVYYDLWSNWLRGKDERTGDTEKGG
jgi:hypothetical protein